MVHVCGCMISCRKHVFYLWVIDGSLVRTVITRGAEEEVRVLVEPGTKPGGGAEEHQHLVLLREASGS